ncbi:MAG: hypothetical protein ACI89X_004032 [Planctomycetota bacterium]|jgi:hypothetical protein
MKQRTPTFLFAACLLATVNSCTPEPLDAMWAIRMDSTEDVNKPDRFTLLPGGGIEATAGGNATLWRPDVSLTPPYRMSMRVKATNLELHPHGAGIVFGGSDVDNDKQTYSYFLVRGDGQFLIKTRDGGDTSDICLWGEQAAVAKEVKESGIAINVLAVDVGKEVTRFSVNGTQVHEAKTEALHSAGQYGARLVHDLDVRFDQIEVAAQK